MSKKELKYPQNSSEMKVILQLLELRWQKIIKKTEKRQRVKDLLRLTRDVNDLYRETKELIVKEQIKLDESRKVYRETNILNKPKYFSLVLSQTTNLSFYKKNLRALEQWMQNKKIPSMI